MTTAESLAAVHGVADRLRHPSTNEFREPAKPESKNGIQVRIDNDVFEFAVMLVCNPGKVVSWTEASEEFGITVERCRCIFRQLVKHGIAEYVAPGQYRASVPLRRMVAMHAPPPGVAA